MKTKWTIEDVKKHNARLSNPKKETQMERDARFFSQVHSAFEEDEANVEPQKKLPKYGNKKTVVDGITFDSVKESNRYKELCILQKGGVICDLRLQVQFQIIGLNRGKKGHYVADFVYLHREDGYVVEDVKGMKTDTYKLKKKLMKELWNIDIKET